MGINIRRRRKRVRKWTWRRRGKREEGWVGLGPLCVDPRRFWKFANQSEASGRASGMLLLWTLKLGGLRIWCSGSHVLFDDATADLSPQHDNSRISLIHNVNVLSVRFCFEHSSGKGDFSCVFPCLPIFYHPFELYSSHINLEKETWI